MKYFLLLLCSVFVAAKQLDSPKEHPLLKAEAGVVYNSLRLRGAAPHAVHVATGVQLDAPTAS